MANITINETQPHSVDNILSRTLKLISTFFAGAPVRKSVDVSAMNAHTLSDIGIRREQFSPNFSRFSDDDQKFYWTS